MKLLDLLELTSRLLLDQVALVGTQRPVIVVEQQLQALAARLLLAKLVQLQVFAGLRTRFLYFSNRWQQQWRYLLLGPLQ